MSCFLPIGQADESIAEVGEHVRGRVAHQAHARHNLAVGHAGRPDHPDRAPDAIGHLVGGQHQAAFPQPAAGVLAPNDDLDLLLELDLLQDARQLGALLEQFHELFQATNLDELWVTEQIAHAVMQHNGLSLHLVSGDRRDQPLDDPALLSPVRTELIQAPRKFVGGLTLDLLVQHGGHAAKVFLGGGALEVDDLLLDEVALEHQDDQHRLGLERDQVDVLDPRLADLGSRDQRDVLGDLGQHHRRLLQDAVDAARRAFKLLFNGPPDGGRGGFRFHEEVDEIPVAAVGRDAAGRGVRLLQVPGADQVGQLVADGGGGECDEVLGGEHLRTDRHPRHGVIGDDGLQDLLLALVERGGLQHDWQSRSPSANSDCTDYPRVMPTPVRIYSDYV